jgi:small subunit ribosomal protein S1
MTDQINQNQNEESFETLLEKSISASDNFEPGDKVEGIIVGFTRDTVFVDISGKCEATIDAGEFMDNKGNFNAKQGDKITAYVIASGHAGVELTSAIGRGKVNGALLGVAKDNHIPVEGTVTAKVNGGFSVNLDGTRAFCPLSQIDRKYSENDADYIGKKFLFMITELKGSKDCVVSRRTLIEQVQKQSEETLRKTLHEGDIVDGTVTRVAEFGVFVDFGGIEGLVPRSELSRSRSVQPDSFEAGKSVRVKVVTLDWENRKHSLSIKQTESDPWDILSIKEGDSISGPVVNIIKAGAFVELVPGIEGFIHISRMSYTKHIVNAQDAVTKGQTVQVNVISIDRDERKISLELVTGESNPWADARADEAVQEAVIESVKAGGLVVRLGNGMEGFVPRSETLTDRNTDLTKAFKAGDKIKVVTKELRKEEKRIILSQKEVEKMEERDNLKQYMKSETSGDSSSLGSQFGSLLGDFKKKIGG